MNLVAGIVPVVQTPFDEDGQVDQHGLERVIQHAIGSGAKGLVAPAVASEVGYLTREERQWIVRCVGRLARGRVCFIAGASADRWEECAGFAREGEDAGAAAALVAVPERLYGDGDGILRFFEAITRETSLPLLIQDLQWSGPGLDVATIRRLREELPSLAGLKIETVPAGPKYTLVKEQVGRDFYVAGGWAVPQMIEALDRGVDAMIPEASMVFVYSTIWREYEAGRRRRAVELFRRLLPVLSFTNQEIRLSIAFFKRLLMAKGVIRSDRMRWPGFEWDRYSLRVAEELIGHYLELEIDCAG